MKLDNVIAEAIVVEGVAGVSGGKPIATTGEGWV